MGLGTGKWPIGFTYSLYSSNFMNLTMPLLVATGIVGGSASAGGEITRKATTEGSIFTFYCFSNVAIKLPDAPLNIAPR